MTTPTSPSRAAYEAQERNDKLRAFILSPESAKAPDRPAFRVDWSKIISDRYAAWIKQMDDFNKREAERVALVRLQRAPAANVLPL
jgi:hypothetical protein